MLKGVASAEIAAPEGTAAMAEWVVFGRLAEKNAAKEEAATEGFGMGRP